MNLLLFTSFINRIILDFQIQFICLKSCFSDTGKPRYEIRNAGVANTVLLDPVEFEGAEFVVTSGDYDKLMEKVRIKLTQDGNRREFIVSG